MMGTAVTMWVIRWRLILAFILAVGVFLWSLGCAQAPPPTLRPAMIVASLTSATQTAHALGMAYWRAAILTEEAQATLGQPVNEDRVKLLVTELEVWSDAFDLINAGQKSAIVALEAGDGLSASRVLADLLPRVRTLLERDVLRLPAETRLRVIIALTALQGYLSTLSAIAPAAAAGGRREVP